MKKIILICLLAGIVLYAHAQKPVIDTASYGHWPKLGFCALSSDGNFALYAINNQPLGKATLIIKSLKDNWKREFIDMNLIGFSADSRHLVLTRKDSIYLIVLGKDEVVKIPNVSSCLVSGNAATSFLAYQLNTNKELIVQNLNTGEKRSFGQVTLYQFNANGSALMIQKDTTGQRTALYWVDMQNGKVTAFWQGKNASGFTFNSDGNALAFIVQGDNSANTSKAIWYYKVGKGSAEAIVPSNSNEISPGVIIDRILNFSKIGDKLFFTTDSIIIRPKIDARLSSVDIYSYKDPQLQSEQLLNIPRFVQYTYVYDFPYKHTVQLTTENERIISPLNGDHVLVQRSGPGDVAFEWNWNKNALCSLYLVSAIDGIRKVLCSNKLFPFTGKYDISPTGKYVIYYEPNQKNYYTYNIASGKIKNITKGSGVSWIYPTSVNYHDFPDSKYYNVGVAGWTANDATVWLYSAYDIIQADPEGKHLSINITNGYGAKHHYEFKNGFDIVSRGRGNWNINSNQMVLLRFTNDETKEEGFCMVTPGLREDPKILSIQQQHLTRDPQKAAVADLYTVELESADSAPNYYLTADFKTFNLISDVHPEKEYNWLKSELFTFKTIDGGTTQGVLYKPADFDPKKKYPVIFLYYERETDQMHHFVIPNYVFGEINIPSFVSNGYLVFTPDIHYKIGHPGQSAYNSIMGAADYLSRFSWVNKNKMGLVGHSFGGFETDYMITHTHRFAAALSLAGITDFVSAYGSIILGNGSSRARQFEIERERINTTLWQRPYLYIENSPVFKANQVTTPILIMANLKDSDVPAAQGFEFFIALRRLEKKSWLLQYDNDDHSLLNRINQKDLFIRTKQFFDYYLKNAQAPVWMTTGVPASLKQRDAGYAFDASGSKPY